MAASPRILFCAATPMNVAVFRPIVTRLALDERLSLFATSRHRAGALYRALEGFRLPPRVTTMGHLRARLGRFDLAICPGFYFRKGHVGRRVQVFHGVSFKLYAVSEKLRAFGDAFVVGEFHHRLMVRRGLDAKCRLWRIGMPKTDPLVQGTIDRDAVLSSLSLDPGRPVVLYAPTRSSRVGSSLDRFGSEIIERLGSLEDCSVIVKLHDRSLRRWGRREGRDWASELSIYRRHPRIRLATTHDIIPLLGVADLLVSDVSSVANEYLLCDRPIVHMDLPDHDAWIGQLAAEFGEADLLTWGRETGEVIGDPRDLPEAVETGLAHPRDREAARRRNADVFFYHPGRATEAAVSAVYEMLDLPPPAPEAGNGEENRPEG